VSFDVMPFIGCLHDPANVQQTCSKRRALARVFWIHLLKVCWTFAGSCKHPITQQNDAMSTTKYRILSPGLIGLFCVPSF